ncbi:MAG: tRNA (5-methylaminomethyl-2-thiouridine)(34)-methyltransferase MnmD [Flavobacteriales bacterium]
MSADKGILKIITTDDGSHSLLNTALNETYHSRHGAMRESQHVFIEHGLLMAAQKFDNIRVLEVGFGTGLNAWLTWLQTQEKEINVHYTALDTVPLEKEIVQNLNYAVDGIPQKHFRQLHDSPWNLDVALSSHFTLHKQLIALQQFVTQKKFHCIYYDAFGPQVQPEMWKRALFEKMYAMLEPAGVLVTYCAKGQVRRDLASFGFQVERMQGPPGKREMLRACK